MEIEAPIEFSPVESCCARELLFITKECHDALRWEYECKGKGAIFEACQSSLDEPTIGRGEALGQAAKLGMSAQAFRCLLSRLRQRYRQLVAERMLKVA